MTVHAEVGNWLVVRSRLVDQPVRAGQIVDVSDPDGSPPYVVHWLDDERTSVVFPGTDAVIATDPPGRPASPDHG